MHRSKTILFFSLVTLLFCSKGLNAQSTPGKTGEWEKTIELAKKEGKVVASIPPSPELRKSMELAFTRRYGVGVEFVPARGGAIIQRMVSEAKTGTQYFDLHIGGTESIVTGLLPEKVLDPVEPYMMLAEVKDPKQWWGGYIWADNAKRYIYNFVAYQTVSLWCNANEYKAADFKSFDDLLNELPTIRRVRQEEIHRRWLEARNLFGQDYEEFQESGDNRIDINSYRQGQSFSASFTVRF